MQTHFHAYSSDRLGRLERAFGAALKALKASDPFRDWSKGSKLRTELTEKLLILIDSGVTDPEELQKRALEAMPVTPMSTLSARQSNSGVGSKKKAVTGELLIEIVDDEIIVSLAGTSYSVTYYKREACPRLIGKRISDRNDPRASMTVTRFLALAWRLANDTAREVGWFD